MGCFCSGGDLNFVVFIKKITVKHNSYVEYAAILRPTCQLLYTTYKNVVPSCK